MKIVGLILFLFCLLPEHGQAFPGNGPVSSWQKQKSGTELLLSRLELNGPGLSRVKISADNPEESVAALLAYFRDRSNVKHPIDRGSKEEFSGNIATERDFKYANEALEHIFVGQTAYPSHFCGEDIDWNTRPVPDMEWVWQLNRMYFWNAMGKVYWHTGDEKYAEEWCKQVIDWIQKNPNDPEHKYAWRSIEAGIRGHNWTGLYQYFLDSPHFTADVWWLFLTAVMTMLNI